MDSEWSDFLKTQRWFDLQYKMALVFMDQNKHVSYQYCVRTSNSNLFELEWLKLVMQDNKYVTLENTGDDDYSDQLIVVKKDGETNDKFFSRARYEMRAIASKTAYMLLNKTYDTTDKKTVKLDEKTNNNDNDKTWMHFLRTQGWNSNGSSMTKGFNIEGVFGIFHLSATSSSLCFDYLSQDKRRFGGSIKITPIVNEEKEKFTVKRDDDENYTVFYFRALATMFKTMIHADISSDKHDTNKEQIESTLLTNSEKQNTQSTQEQSASQ